MRRAWSVILACASSARKRIGRSRVPVAASAPLVAYLATYAATARSVRSWPPVKSVGRIVDLRPLLGALVHTFAAEGVEAIGSILEWRPSEATAMLAATARGARGICEVRDAGLPVPLTDEGPTVHEVDLDDAVSRNSRARAIMTTATLDEAEAYSREICGFSGIDYERNKAAWLTERPPTKLNPDAALSRLDQFQSEARTRGATHTTFRHLTEALNLSGSHRDALRQLLISSRPEQYTAPLWRIPSDVSSLS